ncbi:MAG TPA: prolyl oligopeptidase family serine peptidase [Niabella sp.]|nr:prolyl oligopeptidase family serine peptidase [Niabella sp.]
MRTKLLTTISLVLAILFGHAQEDVIYQKPSAPILSLADYEPAPSISMDTKKNYMLLLYRNAYKTLEDLSQNEMRLAGLRINPVTNISTTTSYFNNIKLRKIKDVKLEPVQVSGLPADVRITNISWSPDDTKIAFTHTTTKGVELWVIDVATASASKITDTFLNANLGTPFVWLRDNKSLLVQQLVSNRPALIDSKNDLPIGPVVSIAEGKVSQNRTYQDLLKNKADEHNFETLVTSEIYKTDINGNKTLFKTANMYADLSLSPDGHYVMITTLQKPFSYIVPLSRFATKSVVYAMDGKEIKTVYQKPLTEVMAKGFSAVAPGKRSMNWRTDKPASLYFIEALNGGDPAKPVDHRDQLFIWEAPFDHAPIPILKTINRASRVIWGNDDVAVIYDNWYDTRNIKTYLFNPAQSSLTPQIISDRNIQDIYSDPGNFETKENEYGKRVLAIENGHLILVGEGFTKEGQFPFIDELNIKTLKTKRLYKSSYTDKKEDILSVEDFKAGLALVRIQSKNEYPNYYFRNYKKRTTPFQITYNKNPFEAIKEVHKEVIKYKRADGVDLSGTLYLPVGYDITKKEKRPLLIWAYPAEFKDRISAGQSDKNPNEFTAPSYGSFIYWVTKGYVVLDDASFPIIGEGSKEPNDTFIEQLVANGRAAIDAVDKLGYIDRTKVAVGGHSYGAFMTANLLAHSNDFACGVARSGAYNRTLTPFGFQSEQRNYWDVPELYNKMSPFMNANKIKKPILLIHGEADNNPGTFTLQTERLFQAVKGLGGKARMVLLPRESHGYAAKESILHVLWEQEQFLDKYLKGE